MLRIGSPAALQLSLSDQRRIQHIVPLPAHLKLVVNLQAYLFARQSLRALLYLDSEPELNGLSSTSGA